MPAPKKKKGKKPAGRPPRSLRKAIDMKCKDCIYDDQAPGTWRIQVEECTINDCPLYNVRPKSKREKPVEVATTTEPA